LIWLTQRSSRLQVDRVIFVVFLDSEFEVYKKWMTVFFPVKQPTIKVTRTTKDHKKKDTIYHVECNGREIALTLDDIPSIGDEGERNAIFSAIKRYLFESEIVHPSAAEAKEPAAQSSSSSSDDAPAVDPSQQPQTEE